ncbi:MAG: ABC transporter permease [Polyangiales bacterium]
MTLTGLAARNVLRNKFRAILTIAGVAVAILTFVMLRTIVGAWTVAADFAVKDRLVTRHKVTFVMTLPKRYIDQVRSAPHIKVATWANWFGGKDMSHEHEFFANFAVDGATYFQVYDDFAITPELRDTWMHDAEGAIVGDVLAKKMGWKVGDKVTLVSGIYPDKPSWEFTIDGMYEAKARSADRSSFFFHWDYLDKNIGGTRSRDQIGWIVSRVDDPTHTADVGVALDRSFDDREIQTLSQDEHAFNASFLAGISAVLTAIDIISVVILAIMALVLGNTIAMGVRERTQEHGVLKALGFSGGQIAGFVVAESVLIALAGGVLGVAVAYPFIEKGMGRWLEENMGTFFPYFRVDPRTAVVAIALAVLLGVLAALIPALRASRLRTVDALRRTA